MTRNCYSTLLDMHIYVLLIEMALMLADPKLGIATNTLAFHILDFKLRRIYISGGGSY